MPVTFGMDYLNEEDVDDDDKSPYLPKRYSILESGNGKGIVGGSSASPEEENLKSASPFLMQYQQHRQSEEEKSEGETGGYTTGVIKLDEDFNNIELR